MVPCPLCDQPVSWVTVTDAANLVRAGYDMALIGSALMTADDPVKLLTDMLVAGRGAR